MESNHYCRTGENRVHHDMIAAGRKRSRLEKSSPVYAENSEGSLNHPLLVQKAKEAGGRSSEMKHWQESEKRMPESDSL